MHVHTETHISPDEIKARFESVSTSGLESVATERKLIYASGHKPPKFFLSGVPVTLPAAAEVAISERPGGAEVVLRLMWGPLPAPFPRALAAVGIVLGLIVAYFSNGSAADRLIASLIVLLPIAALFYQQRGEQNLQSRLANLLGGVTFSPKSH